MAKKDIRTGSPLQEELNYGDELFGFTETGNTFRILAENIELPARTPDAYAIIDAVSNPQVVMYGDQVVSGIEAIEEHIPDEQVHLSYYSRCMLTMPVFRINSPSWTASTRTFAATAYTIYFPLDNLRIVLGSVSVVLPTDTVAYAYITFPDPSIYTAAMVSPYGGGDLSLNYGKMVIAVKTSNGLLLPEGTFLSN